MTSFEVEIQGNAVDELKRLQARLQNPAPLMTMIGAELDSMAAKAFENQETPDGKDWKELSPVTEHLRGLAANGGSMLTRTGIKVAAKYKKGVAAAHARSGILNDTSSLIRTLRFSASAHRVRLEAGPHPSGVAIHLLGGMAGRNRKVEITARPWWPVTIEKGEANLTPAGEERVLSVLRNYVEGK
ncbi:MAG: phage virion morphogenesis protein [Candidatus Accumulibacter sp.]|jgi:phage gpG-like protein|nr:phage virion morphogenesis protein [Accumulibacter sp.]